MWSNSKNGFDIYYTTDDGNNFWSIRSEDEFSYWFTSLEDNGPYPSWYATWDLQYEISGDLGVPITINCSESFSPSLSPQQFHLLHQHLKLRRCIRQKCRRDSQ